MTENTFPVYSADAIVNFYRTEVLTGQEAKHFTKSDLTPAPKVTSALCCLCLPMKRKHSLFSRVVIQQQKYMRSSNLFFTSLHGFKRLKMQRIKVALFSVTNNDEWLALFKIWYQLFRSWAATGCVYNVSNVFHSVITNTLIQIWQHTVYNALTVKNVKASQVCNYMALKFHLLL